jgi:hypothetical protein
MARDTQPEEVEQRDAAHDRQSAPEHRRRVHHLVPSTPHVEEGRVGAFAVARREHEEDDGQEQDDGDGAEEALIPDCDERCDLIPAQDVLLDYELGRSAREGWTSVYVGAARSTLNLLTRPERRE